MSCTDCEKFVRIAITRDGEIEIWDKQAGIYLSILDYRKPANPEIKTSLPYEEIGFDGDY